MFENHKKRCVEKLLLKAAVEKNWAARSSKIVSEIAAYGTSVLDVLFCYLSRDSGGYFFENQGLSKQQHEQIRSHIFNVLRVIGEPAIDALLKEAFLRHHSIQSTGYDQYARALAWFGKPSIPKIIAFLRAQRQKEGKHHVYEGCDLDQNSIDCGVEALRLIGHDGISALVDCYDYVDERKFIAKLLNQMSIAGSDAISTVLIEKVIWLVNVSLVFEVATFLEQIGKAAVPCLRKVFYDSYLREHHKGKVKLYTVEALAAIPATGKLIGCLYLDALEPDYSEREALYTHCGVGFDALTVEDRAEAIKLFRKSRPQISEEHRKYIEIYVNLKI